MKIVYSVIIMFFFTFGYSQSSIFNSLLQKHVDENGNVDYRSFKKDEVRLNTYLAYLGKTNPKSNWSSNKEKAFWINVYNAYTIKIILENYPVESINSINKDGKKVWKIPFVKVGGKIYTLDYVEHTILRKKHNDPRIHVGVNCASVSCPKLLNKEFTEANIEFQLDRLMKSFINDTSRNKLSTSMVQLSQIFKWFPEDFKLNGSIINYINKYAKNPVGKTAKIEYLNYNWGLNKK